MYSCPVYLGSEPVYEEKINISPTPLKKYKLAWNESVAAESTNLTSKSFIYSESLLDEISDKYGENQVDVSQLLNDAFLNDTKVNENVEYKFVFKSLFDEK